MKLKMEVLGRTPLLSCEEGFLDEDVILLVLEVLR